MASSTAISTSVPRSGQTRNPELGVVDKHDRKGHSDG